jgi:small subunit ribosomal protein S12
MHSAILVKPAKVKDLIGINHVAIRGKLDLLGVAKRRTTRSAYGVKRG